MTRDEWGLLTDAQRRIRNRRLGFLALRVSLALIFVGMTVYGVFGIVWSLRDAGRSAAFHAAPACTGTVAPESDCRAWKSRKVTGIDVTRKAGTTVFLSKGQQIYYLYSTTWVDSLKTGMEVPVLEWRGTAEALRRPDGTAVYSENSAPLAIYQDVSAAVLGFTYTALATAALLGLSRLRVGRPWLKTVAVLLAILGATGFVDSIVISQAMSFRAAVVTGLIVYLSLALVVAIGIAIWRARRRRALRARLP